MLELERLEEVAVLDHRRHDGAHADVGVSSEDRLGVGVELLERQIDLVEDGRASARQHLEGPARHGGVRVLGRQLRAAVDTPDHPKVERHVVGSAAIEALPGVRVRVNQPRHREHSRCVDFLLVLAPQPATDLDDPAAAMRRSAHAKRRFRIVEIE